MASASFSSKKTGDSLRCLITAGPTREYLDPVRFVSNASSGKMGFALAEKAVTLGWAVDLVAGPVALKPPAGVRFHGVVTADEMLQTVQPLFDSCDLLFMVAAVSDYRPLTKVAQKMKKTEDRIVVEMVRTPDILRTLAQTRKRQVVVGFAAETRNLESYAADKLAGKGMDWVVANDISRPDLGMEVDDNEIILMSADGISLPFGPAPKSEVAEFIIREVSARLPTRT